MAQKALGYHSFEANVLTINGVRIGNFTEDGGIGYERGSQARDSLATADGYTTVYRNSDQRLIATIEVMETSASYPFLYELYRTSLEVERDGRRPPSLVYAHADLISGEEVSSAQAHFLNVPTPNKARAPGARAFMILLPYEANSITPAPLNVATAGIPSLNGIV